jgi:hypothetical protein
MKRKRRKVVLCSEDEAKKKEIDRPPEINQSER